MKNAVITHTVASTGWIRGRLLPQCGGGVSERSASTVVVFGAVRSTWPALGSVPVFTAHRSTPQWSATKRTGTSR